MRNLTILSSTSTPYTDAQAATGVPAPLCVNVTERVAYAVIGDKDDMASLVSIPFGSDTGTSTTYTFLMERESVFLALASGDIFVIQVSQSAESDSEQVELVGSVDAGIAAACWSPDEELLVLVTHEDKLLLMTQDFEVLYEFGLAQATEVEEKHVALGWGKKETQYHGKAGKAAALAPQEPVNTQLAAGDDGCVRVSWRGDGAYVAVSFVSDGAREIRVFSREGKLHSICEKIKALEHVMAWRPSGRLIAATEKLEHRHDVVFFERNGLRHGEFTLRPSTEAVMNLTWNSDSSIVAVTLVSNTGMGPEVCVELWSDKNYHWYLKQEIRSSVLGDTVSHVVWDTEDPMLLHIAGEHSYTAMRLQSTPAVAQAASEQSISGACVVDGAKLLYTPFAYANVPPPMALHTLTAPSPIAHVAFGAFGDGNDFAALLADGRTVVTYNLVDESLIVFRQIAWPAENILHDVLSVVQIEQGEVVSRAVLNVEDMAFAKAVKLVASPNVNKLLLETADGSVFDVEYTSGLMLSPIASLPEMCVDLDAVSVDGKIEVVACSSFFMRRDFLLLTTTTHFLRFVPVDTDFAGATVVEDAPAVSKYDETRRRVERGSTIVLASTVGDSVVFQMPRGNLETVRPRALVLSSVRRLLDARSYKAALVLCRVNRIDMNVIFDHIPDKLIGDFAEFVNQVNDPDLLNLFVSGLRDEDVTKSMYTGTKAAGSGVAAEFKVEGKTTKVCRALRPVLQDADAVRYMPTILTTFMCQVPADIPSALKLLAPLSTEERDSALTYLLFLSDVDRVYNAALGLYDLPLALLVAQRSQRDPREYLAALGKLNALPDEEYRRFKIDAQLARASKALEHLYQSYRGSTEGSGFMSESDLWSEIVEFVSDNELYEEAIKLLNGQSRFSDICRLFGDHLVEKREFAQAASAYLLADARTQAVDAFIDSKEWREAMALATDPASALSAQAVHDIAVRASLVLAEHHMFMDAATVLLEYTEEDEDALELLVKGSHWAEALRQTQMRARTDLIETTVLPGIQTAYTSLLEDIEEIREAFDTKLARLTEVRAKPLEVLVNKNDGSLDNIDVMSDTTSMASRFSTFTATVTNATSRVTGSTARRISKNRRKAERKKVRGKKGSVYEEAYLVDSLAKLIDRVRVHMQGVREMNLALIRFSKQALACGLQDAFALLVGRVLENADRIFDEQRVQMQLGENGIPEPVPMEVNEFGLQSQPKHPKPALPTMAWRIRALC
ncbi:IkappaB kinase complex, IKAP component [Linderina pennispora]|uniref:Elongator complex protein 1 n=1 Tax=Linderina pennispora TaxID=61395 RepID=A0A1Y1W733_9FUNG|nr:IkappaB kinase complex, IKAP component [Linderina pennispora]ORX69138.1 IkappaB kinase complex, IKAP component [Linderina pennispora]